MKLKGEQCQVVNWLRLFRDLDKWLTSENTTIYKICIKNRYTHYTN
jgi:hypothetical protein